jgi:hypothetical protein
MGKLEERGRDVQRIEKDGEGGGWKGRLWAEQCIFWDISHLGAFPTPFYTAIQDSYHPV